MPVYIKSTEAERFQTNLCDLARVLKDFKEALDSNQDILSHDWQDEKFESFSSSFQSRKDMIVSIAEDYEKWAKGYIQTTIDYSKEVEGHSVSK